MDFEAEEFWGELVLCGIGGRTIEEAKQRISTKEFNFWKAYRIKYGSLALIRRIEQSFGNLMSVYFSSKGAKNVDPYSFMPHEKKPQQEEMSLEEYMMKKYGDGN